MGCKSEIFSSVLASVAEETEVPEDEIISGTRSSDVVDARYLLVKLLSMKGLSASSMAPLISHTSRSVNRILSGFEDRMKASPMMRINYVRLMKKMGKQV